MAGIVLAGKTKLPDKRRPCCSCRSNEKRAAHSNGPARLKLKEEVPNAFLMPQPNSRACASTDQPILYPATTVCRAQEYPAISDRWSKTPAGRWDWGHTGQLE